MQGPAAHPSATSEPRPSLAQRAFPRRVRTLLEGILDYLSDELDRGLATTLNEFEQQLFKQADQARNNQVQKVSLDALREVKRGRADLLPRFLLGLEAALATLKDPPRASTSAPVSFQSDGLSLVEDVELDEASTINEIAGRTEIRNSLTLFLLGQRFGVLAGRPAFDTETLPVGPHALCRVLRDAVGCLDLNAEFRQQLFRQFDRSVMQYIGPLYEALNSYLIRQRVLPHLTYVPVRVKPAPRATAPAATPARLPETPPASADTTRGASAERTPVTDAHAHSAAAAAAPNEPSPLTAWPGVSDGAGVQAQQDAELFNVLRQLLAGRRSLLGKLGKEQTGPSSASASVASQTQLQSALSLLQTKATAPVLVNGQAQLPTVQHVKQDLLAQLRHAAADGQAPALAEEHSDTIDLVGMLFDHILKDVRPNSPAAMLLTKLQVPLLRVAVDDKGFFTRKQHPARQMLNTIAESGAYWSSEDDADRVVIDRMSRLVERVTREFSGDPTLFETLLNELSTHMQTQARKAEVAERRHVEAARGKEKLEVARLRAAEAIDARLAGKAVPKFLHALLSQAWSDVLALALLRGGENCESFHHQLHIAERLIESAGSQHATGKPLIGPGEAQTLKTEIEEALGQVGYYGNDAQAISARLLAAAGDEEEDDPASRTELAMRLKSRTRLGQNQSAGESEKLAPLNAQEQECLEQIRHLPFGTWFEFVINQQGDIARRRLSWFSPLTGHCLFVNHRGQRVGEYSLPWLAREVHRGNVRIVQTNHESLVDRAWSAIISSLRSFAGRGANPTSAS